MSIHAGSILTVGGNNVVDRIQSAGLGDVRLPVETIRETGNREVVDKIPTEPDFTFTLESLNVSTELMAMLTGKWGGDPAASGQAPGYDDPDGTEYDWLDTQCINIVSPWKDPDSAASGIIEAGLLVPGYYPTRLRYSFGVTANATQQVDLGGGSYYYAKNAPVEEQVETTTSKDYTTAEATIAYRKGGAGGSTFRNVFGVILDGQLLSEGPDYTVTGGGGSAATIHLNVAPTSGQILRFCYFTNVQKAYPQSVHASVLTVPGAVRGRNIHVFIDGQKTGGIQSLEMEATVDGEVERELGTEDIVGRVVNGTDCNGTLTYRPRDADAFFQTLERITGVDQAEVYGWFNENTVQLDIVIENPKNPGTAIKTIQVPDAKFQPPGTPARVNSPTDFSVQFESVTGTFKEIKGHNALIS
jgi:hypothetical protein